MATTIIADPKNQTNNNMTISVTSDSQLHLTSVGGFTRQTFAFERQSKDNASHPGFKLNEVVLPNSDHVTRARLQDLSLVDHIYYDQDQTDWSVITKNFVVGGGGDKKRVRFFIESMHQAKIETEREMRSDLDRKFTLMDPNLRVQIVGKTISEKITALARIYNYYKQQPDLVIQASKP